MKPVKAKIVESLPRELTRSTPRPVKLTGVGFLAAVAAVALFLASFFCPLFIYIRAASMAGLAVTVALLPAMIAIVWAVRRQIDLLSEGRAALARVNKVHKRSNGEHNVWRIHYEWTILSG